MFEVDPALKDGFSAAPYTPDGAGRPVLYPHRRRLARPLPRRPPVGNSVRGEVNPVNPNKAARSPPADQ